jgi:hypothetical protein
MPLETFGQIVNEVLQFGFNDGPQVNRRRIENWVNEGQLKIARQVDAPEFQETEEIVQQAGVWKYPLPEGFLRLQDIYYPEYTTRLRPVDLQQFDLTAPALVEGPPEIYVVYQNELWVFPASIEGTGNLELRYFKKPPKLAAEGDVPTLNVDYLDLLVTYAVIRAYEAEDDLEMATSHKARWKEDLDEYASDVQWRVDDRPRVIDGTWGSGGYGGHWA